MDQVVLFDKSLQERLQEYNEVFSSLDILPANVIEREWGYYLEMYLDPIGWQAVWKIPRLTCESLNISFPTFVLVLVCNVEFKHLRAIVRILAVQDDIHLPEKHYVPLIQLWPTKDQDKTVALNLNSTANSLDMLRFFYLHIFMPWDLDDDFATDWKSKHLEPRLRLYFDLKHGIIPRTVGEYIHAILSEARRLQGKRELIESKVSDGDNIPSDKLEPLLEIHIRLPQIRNEIESYENPLLRPIAIRKKIETENQKIQNDSHVWIIFDNAKIEDYLELLTKLKECYPKEAVSFATSLTRQLESTGSNNVFILSEGVHCIRTTGALEAGGTLKGFADDVKKTIVTSKIEDVMLDLIDSVVRIENVTIDATSAKCAILVRRGKCILKNCRLVSETRGSTHQGIIVLNGAELELQDCEISGFSTAVVGNSGSKITMENSLIFNVNIGLKIFDKCLLNATKSSFHDCLQYGVVVETENIAEEKYVGNFDRLNILPEIRSECINGKNNQKGDVLINQKTKIKPFDDLFENNLDPTSFQDSDEDMEDNSADGTVINNDTVIEAK